jgi:hypothetical protein
MLDLERLDAATEKEILGCYNLSLSAIGSLNFMWLNTNGYNKTYP